MKRRRLAQGFTFLVSLLLAGMSSADEFSNNFSASLSQKTLDALAKDVGALMGGGSFHEGKALGFPVGFDVGVHVPVLKLDKDNGILKDDESHAAAVWGQAELGLPAGINIIARGGKMFDANLVGGGLRYGILNPSVPGLPALSVSALYGKLSHDYLDAETLSANIALSFNVPFIHPYVGAGYDYTTLEPTSLAYQSAPASTPRDLEGKESGYRGEIGVNLSLIPFTYVNLAAGVANGNALYHAGLGVRF